MSLTTHQTRYLRSLAHALKPVVMIGNKGITDSLLAELDNALNFHELIKVSIASDDREARREVTQALCEASGAETVQLIGRISVLYRPAQPARIVLPKKA
ncbi:ribosome assembly RNA-binding protein YhbY [Beggiatoa leptomitoformis]|uniref:Ribosome assembly RNA-binding protein YhbY n=1 Tax=Beggiatoa leptomitoformis TaxID=288004 RepID=A0A2N9YEP4_9GAMM|nr:ribosome assembly RNA-binding protein YhbY [Beggiatoa leptomitoformis]ALG68690.1 ribosome assembly RNA-binding protein YhbY [Beggiatoa leptomitoformis]AUI68957.1 ribosome assembly RNA-binding protein YhbY [Beggiatoa leptomitoformis]